MVGAMLQSTNIHAYFTLQNVHGQGSKNGKRVPKMTAKHHTPKPSLRSFSGLHESNELHMIGSSNHDFLLKVRAAILVHKGTASRGNATAVFERFTQKAIRVMMLAQEESRRLGHNFVGTEQILLGLIGEGTGIAAKILKSMEINIKEARVEVEKIIGRGNGFVAVEIPFTPRAKRVLEFSLEEARQLGHDYIGTEHLLLGLLREDEGVAARVIGNLGVNPSKIRTQVIRTIGQSTEFTSSSMSSNSSGTKMPTLEEYGTNLTKLAEEGKLDLVVGRQKEIERVTQILGRRTKNNPCLIGEPGVGKTTIAEGLAQWIVNGDAPETIVGKTHTNWSSFFPHIHQNPTPTVITKLPTNSLSRVQREKKMATSTTFETGSSSNAVAIQQIPVPISDFSSNSKSHVLRVKVIRKFDAVQNSGKAKFQKILLADQWGKRARLTLFGDNIDIYASIFEEEGIFNIKNVTMKDGSEEYRVHADKSMYVHNSSEIVPTPDSSCILDFLPMYMNLLEARNVSMSEQSFDLVAVVVQVGSLEGRHTRSGRSISMYKLHVIDDSCEDVIPIVLWGTLAQEGNRLSNLGNDPKIVAFNGLRKNIFKGETSFNGWYDSKMYISPQGLRVDELANWISQNTDTILTRKQSLIQQTLPRKPLKVNRISTLTAMKADEVDPKGLYKIRGRASNIPLKGFGPQLHALIVGVYGTVKSVINFFVYLVTGQQRVLPRCT